MLSSRSHRRAHGSSWISRSAAVLSGILALSTFWPRRYWSTDLRPFRNKYLAAEPDFTKLHLLDTKIEMTERMSRILFRKALRLKVAMAFLVAAVLLTALALGLE